jgi:hypothetical protein
VTILRQADINGNGSTDFVWENWDPVARAYRTEFYDFLGAAKKLREYSDLPAVSTSHRARSKWNPGVRNSSYFHELS